MRLAWDAPVTTPAGDAPAPSGAWQESFMVTAKEAEEVRSLASKAKSGQDEHVHIEEILRVPAILGD